MAKIGSEKEGYDIATEGGLRQWEKQRRRQMRVRKGFIEVTNGTETQPPCTHN